MGRSPWLQKTGSSSGAGMPSQALLLALWRGIASSETILGLGFRVGQILETQ